jgi:hypothetical protein
MDISDRFRKLPAEINDPNRQKYSTSGVALIESNEQRSVLLVCHDNKKEFDQPNVPSPRFGIVSLDNASLELCYQPLEWPKKSTKLPEDLEGLSGLPLSGQWSFLAQESSGQVFYVEINKSLETGNYIIGNAALCADNLRDISWNKIGTKPTMQFEGFSVQDISNQVLRRICSRFGRTEGMSRSPRVSSFGEPSTKRAKTSYARIGTRSSWIGPGQKFLRNQSRRSFTRARSLDSRSCRMEPS